MLNAEEKPASVTSQAIIRTPLLTAVIDGTKTVERIEVKRIDFSPRQQTGLHLHPCPVVGFITKGSIFFQLEGQPAKVLKAGDAFFEPANTRVLHFDAQEQSASFVAYYLLGPGEHKLIQML